MKETAVVAEYSVVGVSTLLGGLFIGLNIMIMFSVWTTYTVGAGQTIAEIATQFNMIEHTLIRLNPSLKNGIQEGMKLKVKNRPFLEKDYLNKLKDVLNTANRKYI